MKKSNFLKVDNNFNRPGLFIPSINDRLNLKLYTKKIPSKKNNVLMNSYIENSNSNKISDKGKSNNNSMIINYKNFDDFNLSNEKSKEKKERLINEISELQKKLEEKMEINVEMEFVSFKIQIMQKIVQE